MHSTVRSSPGTSGNLRGRRVEQRTVLRPPVGERHDRRDRQADRVAGASQGAETGQAGRDGVAPALEPRRGGCVDRGADARPAAVRRPQQWRDGTELRRRAQLHGAGEVVRADVRDRGGQAAGEVLDAQRVGVAGRLERRPLVPARSCPT
jgi:hypothetical protein